MKNLDPKLIIHKSSRKCKKKKILNTKKPNLKRAKNNKISDERQKKVRESSLGFRGNGE